VDIVDSFVDLALMGAEWVLWLLLILSVVSVALIIERVVYYARIKLDFEDFTKQFTELSVKRDREGIEKLCQNRESVQCRMILKGLQNMDQGHDAMEQSMRGYLVAEKNLMDRGLVILGTLGNNAPFIGLFGTVIGIIEAFHSLGQNIGGGASVVMSGISEALVATAVGLLVAIPAVIAYNFFQRVVKKHISSAESFIEQLVASFLGSRG